ncbi:MAG TPA: hypothetical protein DF383_10125 [Deltaproteobacteria bacterium]|nr:hypothetical protein [Deltaproteobacteria bacterium]
MEDAFKQAAHGIALSLEAAAVLLIAWGGILALLGLFKAGWERDRSVSRRKGIWVRFGIWLLLGLEFELAADIIRTAITPTWRDLGQVGAIAVIRTFLNYFLERDIEKYGEER